MTPRMPGELIVKLCAAGSTTSMVVLLFSLQISTEPRTEMCIRDRANPAIHYKTTGPEIWEATDGKVDIFVAGIGTGGTISGSGKYLKEQNPNIKVVAVEPKDSPLLSEGRVGPHKIQGLGANFVPETLDRGIYDSVTAVSAEDAMRTSRQLATQEGILGGISSGAAVWAALEEAKKSENKDKLIVAIVPDFGERYISTALYEDIRG